MKLALTGAIALFILFVIIGYLFSDDVYYRKVIATNHLKDPKCVFNWATKHYGNKPGIVHHNASPRHLMTMHQNLYCDEGATVMATLIHKLGYKTRLIDIIGADSIAHHTVLQVNEHDAWVNLDFTARTFNATLQASADSLHTGLAGTRIKPYPRLYNFVINNNVAMKELALKLRGINENGD